MNCALELVESSVVQTGWWKPSEDYQRKVWWVTVNGMRLRHASDVEIELWRQMQKLKERAAAVVAPYDAFLLAGGTAEDAVRKEFGLPAKDTRFSTERKRLDQLQVG